MDVTGSVLDRAWRQRQAVPVTDQPRSWFAPPRWWLRWALAALGVFAATWVGTAAMGDDPGEDIAPRAVMAVVFGAATLIGARRDHRAWQKLQADFPGEREELLAAEQVVRRNTSPVSEDQRRLALRIAELRWRELGGYWAPGLLAVMSAALVVMAARSSPWWLLLGVAVGLSAATTYAMNLRLARRRVRLEVAAAA